MDLCTKLQWVIEVNPLPAVWILWFFRLKRFHSFPCGFRRFHFSTIHCFEILPRCNFRLRNHFRDAILRSFTRHGCCHRYVQFSLRVLEDFCVFFIIWIDEATSPQSSSIVEIWFFFCPFLFFSILSGFTNYRPYFWPHMIWSGSRLNLCQSPPGPHISFWRLLLQHSKFRESFPRTWHMFVRIDIPVIVTPCLLQHVQISMSRPRHVNVLGNVSSVGT